MLVVRLPQEDEVMGEKLDVNLGCPYGPSRPEPWPQEDRASIGLPPEAAVLRNLLAAKDREIAERDEMIRRLLENRGMRAAVERHEEFAAAALAAISGAGISTPAEGYVKSPGLLPNDIRALAAERDVAKDRADKAESERDEARECVKRLCEALRPFSENTPLEPGGQIIGLMREDFASARAATAATPEHLR